MPGVSGGLWYRLRFDGRADTNALAVYAPGLSMNAALWLNGTPLGGSGRLLEPVTRHLYTPLLWPLPPSLLKPGAQANELHVLVVGYAQLRPGLSELWLGPERELRSYWQQRRFWQYGGILVSISVALVLGIYVLMLWWRERAAAVPSGQAGLGWFGWFGIAALVMGLRNLNFVVHEPWGHAVLSNLQWSRLFATGEVLFIACFALFAWRYRQVLASAPSSQAAWLPRAVLAYTVAGAGVLLLAPAVPDVAVAIALLSVWGVGLTLWTQFSLTQAAWRVRKPEPVAIALAGLLYLVLMAHDATIITDRSRQSLVFLRPYAVLPLFLAVGWLLTRRYLDALHEAQRLSGQLAQEVARQRQLLMHNFEQLRQAELQQEREQAQQQERTRLTRELHDGLGLHLLSALQQARQPQADTQMLAATLQDCLDDLRVAVDSLAEDERDPVAVLGSLRYRMAPRLAAAGIELRWEVDDDVPELPWLDPPRVLHLLRIVQEALSNAVRHSGADAVTLSVRRQAQCVEVQVRDNGCGIGEQRRPGRGLSNLRSRARALGATLVLRPAQTTPVAEGRPGPGTLVSLSLPMTLAQAEGRSRLAASAGDGPR